MGVSIGELFIDLGFDVDDTKLKSFDQALKSTLNTMLQLTGVSLSVAGFAHLMDTSAQAAVKLQQLTVEMNLNAQSAQKWGLALHQMNSNVSVEQATDGARKFAGVLAEIQRTGQGPFGALSLLTGGRFQRNMNFEQATAAIAANKDHFFRTQGANPQAAFSKLLDEVGLGAGSSRMFDLTQKQIDQMTRGLVVEQESIEKLSELARTAAFASEQLNKFGMDTATFFAKPTGNVLKGFTSVMQGASGIMGAIGEGNLGEFMSKNWDWSEFADNLSFGLVSGGYNHIMHMAKKELHASKEYPPLQQGAISSWGPDQKAAMIQRLMEESGMNPAAYGHGAEAQGLPGEAYGIAQWHRPRQENFKKWAGHDIHGSTVAEQMAFMNYELTQGMERAAGEKLKHAKTQKEAYDVFKNDYERPAGSKPTITQNNNTKIISNASPEALKAVWDKNNQRTINNAFATINNGSH